MRDRFQPEDTGPVDPRDDRRPTLAEAEQTFRTTCPLCQHAFDVPAEIGTVNTVCPSCAMRFSVEVHQPDDPEDSWQSGCDLFGSEDAVERWLSGAPANPRQLTDRQRFTRWCRQRPWQIGLAATAATTLLLVGLATSCGYWYLTADLHRTKKGQREAEQQLHVARSDAQEKGRLARQATHQADGASAELRTVRQRLEELERGRVDLEQRLYNVQQQEDAVRREARLAFVDQLAADAKQSLADDPRQSLLMAKESLRAKLQDGLTPDRETEQVLRDAMALADPRGFVGHRGGIRAAAITPDGRWLITGSKDATVRLWDMSAGARMASSTVLRGHHGPITSLAVSPDGQTLASVGQDALVILWNLTADDPSTTARILSSHTEPVYALAFSKDGRLLLTGGGEADGNDNVARLWDLRCKDPGAEPVLLRGHNAPILAVAISPDGRWAITSGQDKTIRLWNLTARFPAAEQVVLRGHDGWVGALAVSPDSRQLASGSNDGTVRLWNLGTADSTVLQAHQGWITTVAFAPDGKRLASGSYDRSVRLWDLTADDPSADPITLEGHMDRIRTLAFTPDGHWLVTGSFDRTARLWDMTSEDPEATSIILRGHAGPINALAISADSRWLATGCGETFAGNDGAVRLWDLQLDALLESASQATQQHLSYQQQRQILLEAAQRTEPISTGPIH